jgi:hypothetical protein
MRYKCGTLTSSAKTKPRLSACNGAKVNLAKNGYNMRIGRSVFVLTMYTNNHLTPFILRQVKMNLQDHGALDEDPRSIQLWLSYGEMELKSRPEAVMHVRASRGAFSYLNFS